MNFCEISFGANSFRKISNVAPLCPGLARFPVSGSIRIEIMPSGWGR